MTAATVRPKKKAASNRRHIPVEIVEEILLHLPIKSVLRFSSVSKSWRSIISEPRFIQRYGSAAAVSGRERIFISPFIGDRYSSCSLSSISSDLTIQDATKIVIPFTGTPNLVASCEELWCVEVGESLFLWNPSMNTYKKLADSSPPLRTGTGILHFYGLGYDCVGEDYKILKLKLSVDYIVQTTELYSLRKDLWRNIEGFPGLHSCTTEGSGVFVSGALYWVNYSRDIIVYFDLTTEMYGEAAPPTMSSIDRTGNSYIGVIVLRRKLCTYLNNYTTNSFILWVMEDNRVDNPWTILFRICIPHFPSAHYSFEAFMPLHLYDNGDILFEIMSLDGNWRIFIYKMGDPVLKEIVVGNANHSYVYVESLVSSAPKPN